MIEPKQDMAIRADLSSSHQINILTIKLDWVSLSVFLCLCQNESR
jgi:hypothetical protein